MKKEDDSSAQTAEVKPVVKRGRKPAQKKAEAAEATAVPKKTANASKVTAASETTKAIDTSSAPETSAEKKPAARRGRKPAQKKPEAAERPEEANVEATPEITPVQLKPADSEVSPQEVRALEEKTRNSGSEESGKHERDGRNGADR